jgi:anti-anti-sigma regulatory factor
MRLTTTEAGNVLVVTVHEPRLDRRNRNHFHERVAAYLRPGVRVALGLQNVGHVDGPGWAAVLELGRRAAAVGGEVGVFGLRPPVRALFQKLSLHRRLPAYERPDDAVRAFQAAV